MRKNLIPPIISKPSLPLSTIIHRYYPGSTKCPCAHRLLNHPLFIFRRHCVLQNTLQLRRCKDSIKGLDDTLRRGDIDSFAPIT
jgi:hypothetical protein